jgi:glycosyltransferase involved in cell wall biosynthesis
MSRILFVHNGPTRFVGADYRLLGARWTVREWAVRSRRIDVVATVNAVFHADLVFCWFASWHALTPVMIARLLRKPSLVVVGGYDVACVPDAHYGSQRGGIPRLVARAVMRHCSRLIAISEHARSEATLNARARPEKITVIYPGVEPFPAAPLEPREAIALSVGNAWSENLLRKGLLPFVRTAAHLPELRFVHCGRWPDDGIHVLRAAAAANVEFAGFVSDSDLIALYRRAAVYAQPSLHEGFGLSVAEAMMGGCVPVVTRAGALPEVVDDAGVYLPSTSPRDIADAIRQACTWDGEARRRARDRILVNFSLTKRRDRLYALIDQMLSSGAC